MGRPGRKKRGFHLLSVHSNCSLIAQSPCLPTALLQKACTPDKALMWGVRRTARTLMVQSVQLHLHLLRPPMLSCHKDSETLLSAHQQRTCMGIWTRQAERFLFGPLRSHYYIVDSNKKQHLQASGSLWWQQNLFKIHCHWTRERILILNSLPNRWVTEEISLISADTSINHCYCSDWSCWWWCLSLPEMETGSSGYHIWHLQMKIPMQHHRLLWFKLISLSPSEL